MRIRIEGDQRHLAKLQDVLRDSDEVATDLAKPPSDMTVQKFGWAEAAALVAIIKGIADLAKYLKQYIAKQAPRGDTEPTATLRVKSALGTVTIELAPDVTEEQLMELLQPLV